MGLGKQMPAPVTTQTTQQTLSPQQNELLGLAMPGLREFAGKEAPIPGWSNVAGFDPMQTAGQESVLAAVPGMSSVVNSAAKGNKFFTSGDVLDINRNPGLQGAVDAAVRPITDQLLEKYLPAVRSGSAIHGQYGNSRQGIAEGIGMKGASAATADATARVVNPAYQGGIEAMLKGIGMAPGVAQAQMLPGLAQSGVGDVRQAHAQSLLGEQTNRFNMQQLWPLLMGQQYAGMAAALPGGGATSTNVGALPPQPNAAMQGVGLAAQILPLLAMFGSDRRMKRNVRRIGTVRGVSWYEYQYLGDETIRAGVMADEVPAYARFRLNGIDLVDYGAL
jgi:hypothetical protein